MNSRNENVALFRTAGAAHVAIRIIGDGQYGAACEGCDWTETSWQAVRGAGGIAGHPTDPLEALKYYANLHALECAEVPRGQWPGGSK